MYPYLPPRRSRGLEALEGLSEPVALVVSVFSVLFALGGIELLELLFRGVVVGYGLGIVVGVVLGFVVHEFAHRWIARSRGCWARYRLWPLGLLLTFLSGLMRSMGFWLILILPGYVAVACLGYGRRGEHMIAAAGPLSNIFVAGLALILAGTGSYDAVLRGIGYANAWLAFFNLLPLAPLDGSKVFVADTKLWLLLFISSLALLYLFT